jgi:hypothetical protein
MAGEAEDYADSIVDSGGEFHPAYTQKLAELIVKECVWQVVKDNEVPQNIQVLIGERFKQHFGIKE